MLWDVLKRKLNKSPDEVWPDYHFVSAYWARDLSKEKAYVRKPAAFRTTNVLKQYVKACEETVVEMANSSAMAYYARMALSVITITTTQAGCRSGTLLDATPEAVYIGMSGGKIAVAIAPTGSKMDPANQQSAPIAFTELKDKSICPVRYFLQWISFLGFKHSQGKVIFSKKTIFKGKGELCVEILGKDNLCERRFVLAKKFE